MQMKVKLEKVDFAPNSEQKPADCKIDTCNSHGQTRTHPFTLLFTFSSPDAKDGDGFEIRIRARDVISTSCDELVFIAGTASHRRSFEYQRVKNNAFTLDVFDNQDNLIGTHTFELNPPKNCR